MDANAKFIPISLDKGMFSSGEPSEIPDGYCRSIRNHLQRPNRLDSRPPFVYDTLMAITGLANFDDQTNKVSRMLALASDQKLYEKNTSGDSWSASLGTVGVTRLTDLTNYRGKAYGMMETSGLPAAAFSFDGTTLVTTPFSSAIQARCVTAYLDRVFLAYPRITVSALPTVASGQRYSGGGGSGATVRTIISGTTTTYRAYTNAGVGGIAVTHTAPFTIASSTTDVPFQARWDLRALSETIQEPLSFRISLATSIARLTAYVVGDWAVDNVTGFRFRATTAGTSAAGAPAFNVVLGTQTVDGTVTWTNDGGGTLYTQDITLPTATQNPDWVTYWVSGTIPPHTNTISLEFDIVTGNSSIPVPATAVAFDYAYTDGLSDGAIGKKNYGFQYTIGDFRYPFVNTESTDTATFDLNSIVWSEILSPKQIRAASTYELQEVPGYPTAACLSGGRYLVFKRSAFWIFAGNTDSTSFDVIPIRREDKKEGVGCIGPKALDTIDNDVYFIGEDGVYRFTVGMDKPEEVGGDAMREEIIARGSNWVESQATYNQPILRINKRDKEVYVYTQKGTIYVYNIARKGWSTIDVVASEVKVEVADMIFNPNTRKMYVAFGGFGLARLDWASASLKDVIDNTATLRSVSMEIITRPLEAWAPRIDWLIDSLGIFHLATDSQSGQVLTAYVSTDRGVTYPWTDTVTLDLTIPRNQIDLFESAPSLMLKLSMVGKTGPAIWSVSKFDAEVSLLGGEWPQAKPAFVSSVL